MLPGFKECAVAQFRLATLSNKVTLHDFHASMESIAGRLQRMRFTTTST